MALSDPSSWLSILNLVEDGRTILDNDLFPIFLPSAISSVENSIFKICFSSPNSTHRHAPTAWLHSGDRRIAGHICCALGEADQGDFGLMAELGYSPPLAECEIPRGLLISTITQCNLNCVHCISRTTRTSLNKLDLGTRKRIQQWCDEGKISMVVTDYSGDLLWADEKFGYELDFFTNLSVPFHIDTNGACLSG